MQVTRAAQQDSKLAFVDAELEGDPDRKVLLTASISGERTVEEGDRPLSEPILSIVPVATQPCHDRSCSFRSFVWTPHPAKMY
jgi:hypothetical protein